MKKVIETFRNLTDYALQQLVHEEPSSFNGIVEVRRYRITVEEISESDEVIVARIQKLWNECSNFHHMGPLQAAANRYGVKLNHTDYGRARKKAA